MADKNVTLQDKDGNNLYPITSMGNVSGLSSFTTQVSNKLDKTSSITTTIDGYAGTQTSQILNKSDATTFMECYFTADDQAGADSEFVRSLALNATGIQFVTRKGSVTYGGTMIGAVSEVGTGYIRFTTGIQICWGTTTGSAQTKSVTFAKAFNGTPIVATGTKNSGTSTTQRTITISNNLSSTGFNAIFSASTDYQCYYVAIGRYTS